MYLAQNLNTDHDLQPGRIFSGATNTATISIPGYSSNDYTLTYSFISDKKKFDVACTSGDGGAFEFELTEQQGRLLPGGRYSYFGYASDGSSKHIVDRGSITVVADPEYISWAQKALTAIEAIIAGRADNDQRTTQIGEVQLQHMPPDKLIQWRGYLRAEVKDEMRNLRNAAGADDNRLIYTEFTR